MRRLLPRARDAADPELFAGLVSSLRYCGLLDASVAAHRRAIALDPKVRTSVQHTWFLQRDYRRAANAKIENDPYIVGLSLAETGRKQEAINGLRLLDERLKTRMGDFARASRRLIEGDEAGSIFAVEAIVASGFSDPEGLYYLTRHLAHLNQQNASCKLLERVVAAGFSCYPAMLHDPWLDSIRAVPQFSELLDKVKDRSHAAEVEFASLEGRRILRIES
jgi:hypothetical protein